MTKRVVYLSVGYRVPSFACTCRNNNRVRANPAQVPTKTPPRTRRALPPRHENLHVPRARRDARGERRRRRNQSPFTGAAAAQPAARRAVQGLYRRAERGLRALQQETERHAGRLRRQPHRAHGPQAAADAAAPGHRVLQARTIFAAAFCVWLRRGLRAGKLCAPRVC